MRDRFKLLMVSLFVFVISSFSLAIFRNSTSWEDLFNQINFASLICGSFILIYLTWVKKIDFEGILIALLISLTFFISHQMILLNVDRSRSYFVISWVNEGLVKLDDDKYDYEKVKSSEKLNTEALDYRIKEQISRGYIMQEGQTLRLTFSGRLLLQSASVLSKLYKLDTWTANRI